MKKEDLINSPTETRTRINPTKKSLINVIFILLFIMTVTVTVRISPHMCDCSHICDEIRTVTVTVVVKKISDVTLFRFKRNLRFH